ncbi:MAG: hypothetical protein A2806_00610 [Candidatus Terrybacteria bacterium RIFCSPHIGHO2_01_FULL_48_17]|uniref:DUF1858 domain-containing protein n=1 Tax=Candidatus Terrybacteria bacterium RIFCSPHIGHO2_01_FULL_48_17 TaxID=1802362 RepID=A0A1G2PIG7_9BACT|nr:MAG: hypothetical protein A2806_00610 [Candidatus Terrybacteria bacterium RIFCSPHIGHO2_01_FULL_48_17]OHA53844.1 MAG: hypothetical protein A3A30_01205 [Candidatus Terrybacteria bacterium RIFCSPLOWO2_01_FULL_48_14]
MITKDTNLGELVDKYPALAQFLYKEYGLHCVNCIANASDTLETGMKLHGYGDNAIKDAARAVNTFVSRLNQEAAL